MSTNTYSDGFPLTPLEAIEFSYFLSEGEKQEWREWLQTATIEQQNELVDILHSMWQDNQRQAVPSAFTNNQQAQQYNNQPQTQYNNQPQNSNFASQPFQTNQPQQQYIAQPVNPQPFQSNQQQLPQYNQNTPQFSNTDTSFANEQQFNNVQPQFNSEPQPRSVAPQVQPLQPQPQLATFNTQQPLQDELANFTFVEPEEKNDEPQFEDNFQAPNLSQPQVSQSRSSTSEAKPKPKVQAPVREPVVSYEEEVEDDEVESEHPLSQPIHESEEDNQENALKKMANAKYKPNPILEDKTPPLDEFVYKNGGNNNQKNSEKSSNQSKQNRRENQRDRDRNNNNLRNNEQEVREINRDRDKNKNQQRTQKELPSVEDNYEIEEKGEESKPAVTEERKKAFFSGSKLRQSAAKEMLDEVYKAYQDRKIKSNLSTKELDDKFIALLDKIMAVISNSEQLADYYETIIEKIIEVNDKVVEQAREIQHLKNNTQSRGGVSLQDQVDEIRDDIERLNRDTRTMRIEQRRRYDDVSSQLASVEADSFKQDKYDHIIDRLKSDIIQIQQKLSISGQDKINIESNKSEQDSKNQSAELSSNINQSRKPTSGNKPIRDFSRFSGSDLD